MLQDYATVAALKTYLHITGSNDDDLLGDLVTRASRLIEEHCRRVFYPTSETRYFDAAGPQIYGRMLLLDYDLLSVTTVTNGNGATIPSSDYILRPANWSPYFAIVIKQSSSHRWTYTTDLEAAISVEGVWGYDVDVPDTIRQATLRLAAWLYRQRDTGMELVQVEVNDQGQAVSPPRLPRDVYDMLSPFIRVKLMVA